MNVAFKMLDPIAGVAVTWDEAQRLEQLRSRFLIRVINADMVGTSDIRFITTPLVSGGDLESAARNTGLMFRLPFSVYAANLQRDRPNSRSRHDSP